MAVVSVPCGACGKPVRASDEFCEACGAKVSDALKAALRERLATTHPMDTGRGKNAQTTIGALSILFTLGGVVFFFITKSRADDALSRLSEAGATEPLAEMVEGATTVGELRTLLEREPYQILGLNLFLAAVMLGLWIWSKKALLPAMISALGIYVAVIVASGLYDPKTLIQGVLVKIVVIVALAKGIQSALAVRKLETLP